VRPGLKPEWRWDDGHAVRTAAMNLLRLAGFQSIRAGMQAMMHYMTTMLKMAKRKPQSGTG